VKIIGKATDSYDPTYICTVNRTELEKYLGLYYSATNAKLPELKIGDLIDLGRACDYAQQIANAMDKTQAFVGAHQAVVTAILNGLNYQRIADVAAERKRLEALSESVSVAGAAGVSGHD
jgi:hypothetical protein